MAPFHLFEDKKRDSILFAGIVVVCLIILLFGASAYRSAKYYGTKLSKSVIAVNLTKEEREKLMSDISATEKQIKSNKDNKDFDFATAYLKLGSDYERMGYLERSAKSYIELLKKNPKYVPALVELAHIETMMGELDKAEGHFRLAADIEATPRNYKTLAEFVLQSRKDPERARGIYLEGLGKTKDDVLLIKYFANFLESIGERYEAYLYWDAALKKEPANKDVQAHRDALKASVQDVINATDKVQKK